MFISEGKFNSFSSELPPGRYQINLIDNNKAMNSHIKVVLAAGVGSGRLGRTSSTRSDTDKGGDKPRGDKLAKWLSPPFEARVTEAERAGRLRKDSSSSFVALQGTQDSAECRKYRVQFRQLQETPALAQLQRRQRVALVVMSCYMDGPPN